MQKSSAKHTTPKKGPVSFPVILLAPGFFCTPRAHVLLHSPLSALTAAFALPLKSLLHSLAPRPLPVKTCMATAMTMTTTVQQTKAIGCDGTRKTFVLDDASPFLIFSSPLAASPSRHRDHREPTADADHADRKRGAGEYHSRFALPALCVLHSPVPEGSSPFCTPPSPRKKNGFALPPPASLPAYTANRIAGKPTGPFFGVVCFALLFCTTAFLPPCLYSRLLVS